MFNLLVPVTFSVSCDTLSRFRFLSVKISWESSSISSVTYLTSYVMLWCDVMRVRVRFPRKLLTLFCYHNKYDFAFRSSSHEGPFTSDRPSVLLPLASWPLHRRHSCKRFSLFFSFFLPLLSSGCRFLCHRDDGGSNSVSIYARNRVTVLNYYDPDFLTGIIIMYT